MPKLITTPFAVNGQKNEITVNTPESDNSATYDVGFPPITSLPIASGGKPPKGADFNGLFYDITDNIAYLTLGNGYPFSAGLSYPLNARINRTDGVRVRSTVANNTTNPNTSMTGWEVDSLSPSQNLSELTDKDTARTNLSVYSKAETDAIAGTPNATETTAGKAKIATTAIAQAGVNDDDFITAKKLRDVVGIDTQARLNLQTLAFVYQKNISTVTLVSTGIYEVNLTTPLPNINYSVLGETITSTAGQANTTLKIDPTFVKTTSKFRVNVISSVNGGYYGVTGDIFFKVINNV